MKYSELNYFIILKDGRYQVSNRVYTNQQFSHEHVCPFTIHSKSKNDANTHLSVRDTAFRKHKKISLCKLPLKLITSVPEQSPQFRFNDCFLLTPVLLISTFQFVTRVEAESVPGRPATNLGTKHIISFHFHANCSSPNPFHAMMLHVEGSKTESVMPNSLTFLH